MTPEKLLEVIKIAEAEAGEDYRKKLVSSGMTRRTDWEISSERCCFYIFTYLHKALSAAIENTNQA